MSTLKNVTVKFDVSGNAPAVFEKLAETMRPAFEELKQLLKEFKMKRPRRSRQCRGSRARNYRRTLARCSEGAKRNNDTSRVLAEGQATGAVDAHRRVMQMKRVNDYG